MKKFLLIFSHVGKFYPHERGGPHAPTLRRTKCVMHHLLFLIVIDSRVSIPITGEQKLRSPLRVSESSSKVWSAFLGAGKISLLEVGVLGFILFFELGLHPPFLPVSLGYIRSLLKGRRISWNSFVGRWNSHAFWISQWENLAEVCYNCAVCSLFGFFLQRV